MQTKRTKQEPKKNQKPQGKGERKPKPEGSTKEQKKPQAEPKSAEEKPKKEKNPLHASLASAVRAATVRCNENGTLRYFLEALGIRTVNIPDWDDPRPDGHPVTHVMRNQAMLAIIADAAQYAIAQDSNLLGVLDHYGRNHGSILPRCQEGVGVEFTTHRPLKFGGDLARAKPGKTTAEKTPHVASFVDIYQGETFAADSHKLQGTLRPLEAAKVLCRTQAGVGYVVVHDLTELTGANVFTATPPGAAGPIRSVEGSWISTFVGGVRQVSFKPDQGTKPYPLHPVDHSWLCTQVIPFDDPELTTVQGQKVVGMHVHAMATVGPYSIYKLALDTTLSLPVSPTYIPYRRYVAYPLESLTSKLTTQAKDILATFASTLGIYTLPTDVSGKPAIRDSSGMVPLDGFVMVDTVAGLKAAGDLSFTKVNGKLLQSGYFACENEVLNAVKHYHSRYPGLAPALTMNSLVWGLLQRQDTAALERLATDHDQRSANADVFVKTGDPVKPRHTWILKALLGLGCVAVTGLLFRLLRKRFMVSSLGLLQSWSKMPESIKSAFSQFWTGDGIHPAIAEVAQEYPAVAAYTPKWMMSLLRGTDSGVFAMVCTLRHLTWILGEEVFKYFTGPVGTAALITVEALGLIPGLQSGSLSVSDALTIRLPATLMHLTTSLFYRTVGIKAIPACWAFHQLFNMYQSAVPTSSRLGLAMKPSPIAWRVTGSSVNDMVSDWALRWSSGIQTPDTEPKGTAPLSGIFLKAFPAKPLPSEPESNLDWRAHLLSVTLNGVPLPMERWNELTHAPSENNHVVDKGSAEGRRTPESLRSYPLLITSGALYQPAKGAHTLIASLYHRDYLDPFGIYADPVTEEQKLLEIERRLEPVQAWIVSHTKGRFTTMYRTQEVCARELGGYKGANYLRCCESVIDHGYFSQTQAQAKINETIKGAGFNAQRIFLKPRTVKNVSTDLQTGVLPFSRAFAEDCKCIFNGDPCRIGRFVARFAIAQVDPEHMDAYGQLFATSPDLCCVVSCDDTSVSTGRYQSYFGYVTDDSDFSQYDQSQLKALFDIDFKAMANDVSPTLIKAFATLHHAINSMAVKGKIKDPETGDWVKMRAILRYSMRTGVGTTSSFGGLHNIYTRIYWLLRSEESPMSFDRTCAELGIVVKLAKRNALEGAIFLRGWFIGPSYQWSILPSAVLKLGKLMKNPIALLQLKSAVSDAEAEKLAAQTMFYAIMRSVDVPDDYPLIGAFKRLANRLPRATSERANALIMDEYIREGARYKLLRAAPIARKYVINAIIERYDISEQQVIECESYILSIPSLPALIQHPVFVKLRDVDYA